MAAWNNHRVKWNQAMAIHIFRPHYVHVTTMVLTYENIIFITHNLMFLSDY